MAGERVGPRWGWFAQCRVCIVLTLAIAAISVTAQQHLNYFEPFHSEDTIGYQAVSHRIIRSANATQERARRQLGWQNLVLGPCITNQGKLGRCQSFKNCYPYFKLPALPYFDSWAFGAYDTCSYFTESGQQAFGVCCSSSDQVRPSALPPTAGPSREEYQPNPAIPPNWPPPIPTHSPDNTIPPLPTHPPSHGFPTPPPQSTSPPRLTTMSTHQPTRPTPPVAQWPPPLPTHPPSTRPPWATPPTTTSTQPPWATQPTRPPWTTQASTRPPWATQPTTQATTRPPWATQPTPKPTLAPQVDNEIVDNSCGAKNGYQDQERIVGGQNADVGEWPWIAALFNSGRQFCGGSLVDQEHILTAAHCVAHMSSWDVAKMTVRLGDHNIRTNSETRHVEKKVKRVVRHKGFDPRTLYNDVAILTLESPVTFSKNIRPICLPSGSSTYSGQPATVIGWGSLRESGAQPAVLQEVSIPIWTNQDCKQKYGHAAPGGIIDTFLCAGQPSRDSCSGDSGGPLMVNQGRWTQVGVVSWGIGCGKGQYPGVYTRVTSFLPWIQKNLK